MRIARNAGILLLLVMACLTFGCDDDDNGGPVDKTRTFTLTIENVSGGGGARQMAVPFAPGVWAVATQPNVLFDEGEPDAGEGLEALAEDGDPVSLAAAVGDEAGVAGSSIFNTPVGQTEPAPIGPGDVYQVSFEADPGHYLSFATMYVESNDLFVAPDAMGIALFDESETPLTGDITAQTLLWDAGTEINEEPGTGPNQAPRQAGPDTGPEEGVVQPVQDDWTYPDKDDVLSVMVTSELEGDSASFTVRIEVAAMSSTPLAPGVWVAHTEPAPFFLSGSVDLGLGLEALAEDGDPTTLAAAMAEEAGISGSGVFNTPVGSMEPGPIGPGEAYEFTFSAAEGTYLSFATMYVQSNDLFYAPGENGIELFGAPGDPIAGEVTDQLGLWDTGTEINEEPGVGIHQAPRQSGPNTGPSEGIVQPVDDGYEYEPVDELLRIELMVD
ncbi:MAG: hypothetical protein GF330_12835 [Candidatus Eisenbacteria bacterium]|nr:hypothetical protein [Candidatus Eisenbacteria bacterium]